MRCGFGVGGAKEVLTFCQPFKDRFGGSWDGGEDVFAMNSQ